MLPGNLGKSPNVAEQDQLGVLNVQPMNMFTLEHVFFEQTLVKRTNTEQTLVKRTNVKVQVRAGQGYCTVVFCLAGRHEFFLIKKFA